MKMGTLRVPRTIFHLAKKLQFSFVNFFRLFESLVRPSRFPHSPSTLPLDPKAVDLRRLSEYGTDVKISVGLKSHRTIISIVDVHVFRCFLLL